VKRAQSLQERLSQRRALIGVLRHIRIRRWLRWPACADTSSSFLLLDGEHGVFSESDLSEDLGAGGDFSRPAHAEAFERIEGAALAEGKLLGTAPHEGFSLETLLARGHRLLIIGADMPLIGAAMTAQVTDARACLEASREKIS
jgi:2-keto-3-deoxy-L-rhamnonate aldolase RhmA